MNVVDLPTKEPGEKTVADVLREMARMLDEGRLPPCNHAILVFRDTSDRISPYGLGRMTPYEAGGMLLTAAQLILNAHAAAVGAAPAPQPSPPPAA